MSRPKQLLRIGARLFSPMPHWRTAHLIEIEGPTILALTDSNDSVRDISLRVRAAVDAACPKLWTHRNKRPRCTATAHPLLHLQRAWCIMERMKGDEPTWIVPTISNPCLS
jgi:hypothetical protein